MLNVTSKIVGTVCLGQNVSYFIQKQSVGKELAETKAVRKGTQYHVEIFS